MQRRRFLVPILAMLLIGIAVPVSPPKAHGDDSAESLTISGFLARDYNDGYLGCCVDAVQAGKTLTFSVLFTATSAVYQRNMTMGVRFDWMNNFVNTTSDIATFAGQTVTITLAYTLPDLTGQYTNLNLGTHTWTLEVWDMPEGSTWTGSCVDYNQFSPPFLPSCKSFTQNSYPNHPVAVYNNAQASSYANKLQAGAIISALYSVLGNPNTPAPGTSSALALLAQAQTQYNLANNAYSTGDFATAQTDYQNALNDANAAQSSLSTIGGGTDTATFTSIWVEAVAILFGGISALLVGFAGFKYLRVRTRAAASYSPSTPPKA